MGRGWRREPRQERRRRRRPRTPRAASSWFLLRSCVLPGKTRAPRRGWPVGASELDRVPRVGRREAHVDRLPRRRARREEGGEALVQAGLAVGGRAAVGEPERPRLRVVAAGVAEEG